MMQSGACGDEHCDEGARVRFRVPHCRRHTISKHATQLLAKEESERSSMRVMFRKEAV